MQVYDPRCDGHTAPIDLDTATPRFSWKLADDTRGQRQTAYRILIASTADLLANDTGDLWDSGRVASADTLQVAYAGVPLRPCQACYWKVRAWDKDAAPSPWSPPTTFATALLSPGDWQAKWIGTDSPLPPLFRRRFTASKPIASAQIYICGLGQFELHCNETRVSDHLLQPGWTNYHKTAQYVAYDLTPYLNTGDNTLGVLLGHGMYHVGDPPPGTKRYTKFKGTFGPPILIAQLHIAYTDGTIEVVATDESWETADGPITYSNIYGGEDYDARKEQIFTPPATSPSSLAPFAWRRAIAAAPPAAVLKGSSHAAPPVRIHTELPAKLKSEPSPGVFVYDAGQNCSMIPRIKVRGLAGSTVKLSPAESLNGDGTVNQKHTGSPVYYTYTLKGDGDEIWSPRFSYTGGRYIQVETAPPPNCSADRPSAAPPTILSVDSLHLTSANDPAGTFECSNVLFTKTARLIDWAIRSNTVSILTDCPHREKLGWTEQQHLMGPSLMYAYDLHALYRKACGDHTDAQLPTGDVPTICPQYTHFKAPWDVFNDSPEWGSASVLVPWQVFHWYGDEALLREQYPTMKKYVDYLTSRATDHIVSHGLGDWYDLGSNPPGFAQLTPKELTATAIYFHDAEVLAKVAQRLHQPEDARRYAELAAQIKGAFNKHFYNDGTHQYATNSQTSNAMPLALGLVPEDDRAAVLENLIADIHAHDTQLTSGDVGYRYLLTALAQAGRSDVIFAMNSRSDRPGYGMMIANGETALTEAWDARPQSSLNHFMLGHIQEWFYAHLAGIRQASDSVAFNKIVIQPTPVGDVTRAKATYESARGRISVEWAIAAGVFTLSCSIPPNTTAVVHLPASDTPIDITAGTYKFTASLHERVILESVAAMPRTP